eukprot:CAMPEP_0118851642 /NCGR_PEP_ID=MMETSP1163-20130328/1012_1 /TAXON_ID=124430 /ORGANISM="Phaeomonas parva, Strain CCMP2877" /LENGTH=173 /DNA_ID=CAMNT_0006784015 /DNA_START=187 /DNA_END=705 /DNA_ORIENTATION=+
MSDTGWRRSPGCSRAERHVGIIKEDARVALLSAGLPPAFWIEAVCWANFTKNYMYSTAVNGIPYQLLWNRTPNFKILRQFGATAYHHIPKDHTVRKTQKKKPGPTTLARPGILCGYFANQSDNGPGYYRIAVPSEPTKSDNPETWKDIFPRTWDVKGKESMIETTELSRAFGH